MRLAITIGFRHGCATPVVITGPEVPIASHREAMRETRQLPHHDEFQRIEVWDSGQGRILRKRLAKTPAAKPGPAKPDATKPAENPSSPNPAKAAKPKK